MTLQKEDFAGNPHQTGVFNNATFVVGAEVSNAITVNIQLRDNLKDIGQRAAVQAYLAADPNGDTITALATPTFAAGTDGAVVTIVAGRTLMMISEADGDIDLVITYTTGAGTVYLVLVLPDGRLRVSPAITFA